MSEETAMDKLPLLRAFAYRAWAIENGPWTSVVRSSPGYVAQEAEGLGGDGTNV